MKTFRRQFAFTEVELDMGDDLELHPEGARVGTRKQTSATLTTLRGFAVTFRVNNFHWAELILYTAGASDITQAGKVGGDENI